MSFGPRSCGWIAAWLIAIGCSTHHPSVAGGPCHDNADCGSGERCTWPAAHACGADGTPGSCVAFEVAFCPALSFEVCGCDGIDYSNQCFADSEGQDIDYGGPCRPPATYVACQTSADCPKGPDSAQACIDDPRDGCAPGGATACPGICVHAAYNCDGTMPCSAASSSSEAESPGTQACVAVLDAATSGAAGRCVFTARTACASQTDCNTGELCVPAIGGGGSVCVRP